MHLANDCVWTDDSITMSDPTARRTGLPALSGYETERDADGELGKVTATLRIEDGDTSHRATVTYRVRDGAATPKEVKFPHRDRVYVEWWLSALAAGAEAVSRLGDVTVVETAEDVLEDLHGREPAESWEVTR